ncbi:MAG TPA: sigma-70 family RNA polymerase sigma factor [Gemmataceae bacterium]|nr:sigma-70 family RNA polymerase sigma factor [Gemmataceae bacterium]
MTKWERIVQDHGPMVFGTAWRILGHAVDAEDVVQDVFLEVHRLWMERPVRHWGGLLRRLTSCRAVDRLRARKNNVCLNGLSLMSLANGPEESAIANELSERLREAIARLPEREGAVFCMRYFDDLPYEEIAESMGITRGAVATALHKARAKLETALLPNGKPAEDEISIMPVPRLNELQGS